MVRCIRIRPHLNTTLLHSCPVDCLMSIIKHLVTEKICGSARPPLGTTPSSLNLTPDNVRKNCARGRVMFDANDALAAEFRGAHNNIAGVPPGSILRSIRPTSSYSPGRRAHHRGRHPYSAGDQAGWLEFFTANIRNPHTRRAYAPACGPIPGWWSAPRPEHCPPRGGMGRPPQAPHRARSPENMPMYRRAQ